MKCIGKVDGMRGSGIPMIQMQSIRRVSDEEAERLTAQKTVYGIPVWDYVPKQAWKRMNAESTLGYSSNKEWIEE